MMWLRLLCDVGDEEVVEVGLDFEAHERTNVPIRLSASGKRPSPKWDQITWYKLNSRLSKTRDTSTLTIHSLSTDQPSRFICRNQQCPLVMAGHSSTVLDMKQNELLEGTMTGSGVILPDGFVSIQQILELPNDKIRQNCQVNVIGLVTDFQAPIQSKGSGRSFV